MTNSFILVSHYFQYVWFPLIKGPISFRPVSLLFTVMPASIGALALETPKAQRRGTRGRWFLIVAGWPRLPSHFPLLPEAF
jgi:hypothetical protein